MQRLSNKLLSALRKQQKIEISFTAVSAEARALAAETALLVKKYSVLEEQVSSTKIYNQSSKTSIYLIGTNINRRIETDSTTKPN